MAFWSRELFRIFGLDAERTALNIDLIKKFRHPEDRPLPNRRLIRQSVKKKILKWSLESFFQTDP